MTGGKEVQSAREVLVLAEDLKSPLIDLLLALADDKFILGQRNADWTGLGPILEEDIAFSSLAQDDLAHASALYEFIAGIHGDPETAAGRANRLAYGRRPEEYRCAHLVELADEFDWGVAIVRQFLCDHFDFLRLSRLAHSSVAPLGELAQRMVAEERLSIGHADQWIVRLGRGTEQSRQRIQAALTQLAPLGGELFEPTADLARLEAQGVYPPLKSDMFLMWEETIENVVEEATLHVDLKRPAPDFAGGRSGRRSAAFAELHAELTEVYRVEPEAAW
jgi:ring-1,2-phenylacetyl-CoA epoxidase subunit PaaC